MAISKQLIDQALENLGKRDLGFKIAQPFENFTPLRLTEDYRRDPTANTALMKSIAERSRLRTAIEGEKIQNQNQYEWMQSQQQKVNRLTNQLEDVRGQGTSSSGGGGGQNQPQGPENEQGRWGTTPEVSDIGKLRPRGPQKTMTFHGIDYTVNKQVAPIFQAFLRDLWQKGYKPAVIQGQNTRNIAGTNTPSLHSYGFAIDVDPTKNPEGAGRMQDALPPGVGALAAKYGLAWGGNWTSRSPDPMHFSVPWKGRE